MYKEAIAARDAKALKKSIAADPRGALSPRWCVQAAGLGWLEGLALLREVGADLNGSYKNYRPLHALIQGTPEHVECLRWLLDNGADPEQTGAWPPARAILVATWTGEPDYVDALRAAGAAVDGFVAAALGDTRRVKRELARDAGFASARDGSGLTALHCCCASRLSKSAIAKMLLDAGADPNAKVRSWGHDVDPAYFAVNSGQADTLALLVERGARREAALTAAAWKEDPALADLMLRLGADPDRAESGGRPLLNDLIRWGQFKQALFLLERGASPNIADSNGWTALHQAVSRGNERIVRSLLAAGANAAARDSTGATPRAFAMILGRVKILALLPHRGG